MDNQKQNEQTKEVAKKLKLSPEQMQELHWEISHEGLNFHEIMKRAKEMFNK